MKYSAKQLKEFFAKGINPFLTEAERGYIAATTSLTHEMPDGQIATKEDPGDNKWSYIDKKTGEKVTVMM